MLRLRPRRLVAIALTTLVPDLAAQSPMFRGGPDHLGVYDSPAPTLQTLGWKFQTAGRVISTPAVVGDLVYVGSTDGSLYAINRADGTQRWKFDSEGPIASSPAVSGGLVYVSSLDGNVYAVDAGTGARRWSFATGGERRFTAPGIHGAMPRTERMPDPFDVFLSSPAVASGTVYIGSGDQRVYALDAATGAVRWSFATGDVVHASPAVADGVVYIGSWDRNLYALEAATGRERWRYTTGNDTTIYNQIGIASSAAVAGGMVFVGGRDGHFHAVDAKTGEPRWTHDNKGGWTIASPAVKDGVVYFPTSDGRRFKALDAATGAVRIDLQNVAISFSSPAIAGEVAFYGTSDGYLNAVATGDGRLLARFQTDGSKAHGAPYTGEDGVFRTGSMYPDRTLDGMMIGMRTMMTVGSVLSSPVVADGVVYFGSTDGNLYAVR
jgi:outer membrane protein assembly factor BamB